ncbi:MAG: 2-C-methyl-D-erythritol 2,4-cyclodiphosphate synthase, partial [Balneolaceae bacterium]|nr:2-C-methyl-D-erythritol 2,4-cyclodiphosphate synthase [Balneolaceae bacterium]
GYGYDMHRLVSDRPLILGGVRIPHEKGLAGHSDADVLAHAVCDALLGALALGDLGAHFPDTDPSYKDIDSRKLLRRVNVLVQDRGYRVGNIDVTVVAQKPRLAEYVGEMRNNLAGDLETEVERISVKATTSEQLGPEGRGEGISAAAVVLIYEYEEQP